MKNLNKKGTYEIGQINHRVAQTSPSLANLIGGAS